MNITIKDVRAKYPQYADMSDQALADALHKKFYSDMEQGDFYGRIGFNAAAPSDKPEETSGFSQDMTKAISAGIPMPSQKVGAPATDSAPPRMVPVDPIAAAMTPDALPSVDTSTPASPPPTPRAVDHLTFGMMGGSSEDQVMWGRREAARQAAERGEVLASRAAPVDPLVAAMTPGGEIDDEPSREDDAFPRDGSPRDQGLWQLRESARRRSEAAVAAGLPPTTVILPSKREREAAAAAAMTDRPQKDDAAYPPVQFGQRLQRAGRAIGSALSNVPEHLSTGFEGMKLARAELGEPVSRSDAEAMRRGADQLSALDAEVAALKAGIVDAEASRDRAKVRELKAKLPDLIERRNQISGLYGGGQEQAKIEDQHAEAFAAAGVAARKKIDENRASEAPIDAPPGSPEWYVAQAIGTSAEMAPSIVASMVTRSPLPAMAFMGGYSGGNAYVQGRQKGLSPDEARSYASLYAVSEGLPEALPLHFILKPGSTVIKRLVGGAVGEGVQETITEAIQIGIDQGYLSEDMTWSDARKRMMDAGIIGTLSGGAMGGVAAISDMPRGAREKPSRPEKPSPYRPNTPFTPAPDQSPGDALAAAMLPDAPAEQAPAQQPKPPVDVRETPVRDHQTELTSEDPPQVKAITDKADAPATEQRPESGRFEVMDEIETVDGVPKPTGRRVRVNLDTGEAEVVEAEQDSGGSAAPAGTPVPVGGDGHQPQAGEESLAAPPAAEPTPVDAGHDPQGRSAPQRVFLSHDQTLSIETDPKTFQYKGGADAEGVNDRLKGVTRFDPNRAGQAVLFQKKDGTLVVADGHQRTGLARRMADAGQKDVGGMAATIYREADGYTPQEVMTEAAIKNIGEGSGTAVDAARVLRNSKETVADLGLPPNSAMVRTADGLRRLGDNAFGMVANGVASERDGAAVGKNVPDKDLQPNILALLTKLKPENEAQAAMIARDAASEATTETQDSLFGPEQVQQSLYGERAKVLDHALKSLGKSISTFRTLVDRADAITGAGNKLTAEGNAARLDDDTRVRQYLSSQANMKGEISDALTESARLVRSGTSVREAADGFVRNVQRSMEGGGAASEASAGDGSGRPAPEGEKGQVTEPARAGGRDLFDQPGARGPGERQMDIEDLIDEKRSDAAPAESGLNDGRDGTGSDGIHGEGGTSPEPDSSGQTDVAGQGGGSEAGEDPSGSEGAPRRAIRESRQSDGEEKAGLPPLSREIIRRYMPQLRAELNRLGLGRVRLYLDDTAASWQGMFLQYSPHDMEVIIGASMDPMKTIHHEAIHALRGMDLFTPAEWRALEHQAMAKWMAEFDIEARYPDATLEEQLEEAIAEAFAATASRLRKSDNSMVGAAFRKIATLFRAIRSVFNKAGYRTAEDIFGRVYDGKLTAEKQARSRGLQLPKDETPNLQPIASLGQTATNDKQQALQPHMVRWIGQVAKLLGKTKPSDRLPDTLELGPIPVVIRSLAKTGKVKVMGGRLIMSTGKAKTIISAHPEVDQSAWAKLPNLLADPEMIVLDGDPTHAATIKIVTGYQAGGSQIVVMVNTEGVDAAKHPANAVVTLYAPTDFKSMMDRAVRNQHEVLYVKGEHEGAGYKPIGTSTRSASPVGDTISRLRADKSILTHGDVFKAAPKAKFQAAPSTSSEAFKKWFGDSKVVDKDGKPLVVYHGTNQEIDAFDRERGGASTGVNAGATKAFFFTDSRDVAGQYAEHAGKRVIANVKAHEKESERLKKEVARLERVANRTGDWDAYERAMEAWESHETDALNADDAEGQNTVDVYLSIQNPMTVDFEGGRLSVDRDLDQMIDEAKANSHDGLILRNLEDSPKMGVVSNQFVAFRPEQIKSVFNRGTFDPADPRIRYQAARSTSPQEQAHAATAMQGAIYVPDRHVWEELTKTGAPIWSKLRDGVAAAHDVIDRVRIKLQDRFLPVLRAQQAISKAMGQPLREEYDAYLAETTFSGKAGRHLFDIDERFSKPIISLIAETNGDLTLDRVSDYLTARHAQERNERIAKINPKMPDGGSGMGTAEAAAILSESEAGPHAAKLKKIADLIDQMREWALALRVDAGLMTKAEADLWRNQYQHYVPLKGFAETEHSDAFLDVSGIGSRFNTRGDETKRALGRRSKSFNVLQAAITQAQEVAIRSEKARVGAAFYRLARDFPSKAMWEVKKVETKQYFNKTTGLVETRAVDPLSMILKPNEMAVKVNGEEHRIIFHDDRLMASAGTVGADRMNWFVQVMSMMGRWFSATRTMLNPEFVISNAFRDMTAAQINIQGMGESEKAAIAKAMIKSWPRAFRGVYRGQGGRFDTEWSKHYDEFTRSGAKVEFWAMENPAAGLKDLDQRIWLASGSRARRAMKTMVSPSAFFSSRDNGVLHFIERTNMAVDNAIRLAAFVEARKRGWSEAKAAALSKNLTVNFNRRGTASPTINALYTFFNAAVQGSHTTVKSLATSKTVRRVALAMIAAGFLNDISNAYLSHEDDDDILAYDKIPDFQSQRAIQFMLGRDSESALSIPMPYGYNIFPYLGQQLGKVARGVKEPDDAMGDVAGALFGAFSPVQGGDIYSFFMPTVIDPMLELSRNTDWLGRPIKPDYDNDLKPESQKFFGGASEISKAIARAANSMTGGMSGWSGWLDVSPEYIDHSASFIFGSMGDFAGRSVDLVAKAASGDLSDLTVNDIPMARVLIKDTYPGLDQDRYYRFREMIERADFAVRKAKETGEDVPPEAQRWAPLISELKVAEKARKKGTLNFVAFNKKVTATVGKIAE